MQKASIKILTNSTNVHIDREWFPYKDIVDKKQFDKICCYIEQCIERYGIKKIKVSYDVLDFDINCNPLEILIECKIKNGFLKENESSYTLYTNFNN